jgi:hypothetical protein
MLLVTMLYVTEISFVLWSYSCFKSACLRTMKIGLVYFKILGFSVFEQKVMFFKNSLKIVKFDFFQIEEEIIHISRKQVENSRLATLSIFCQCCQIFFPIFIKLDPLFRRHLEILK